MPALQRALMGNTGAHSAVEMALLDLDRPRRQHAADRCRGAEAAAHDSVKPMWLLGNASTEQDIAEARAKEREGFHFFKLKIGVKPLADEIATTLAVREALGTKMPLCADANGGLTLAQRQALCRAHARGEARFRRAAAAA